MTERGCHRMSVEWKDFVKTAYAVKGNMFRLDKGEVPGLVAKGLKIPVGNLLAANPGVKAHKYVAGEWYHLSPTGAAPKPRVAIRPKPAPVPMAAIKTAPRPKAMTPPPLKAFNPADFQSAYDFYRDVAPAIRMRELGVKALPENERKAFEELGRIPVRYTRDLPDGVGARHHYGNGGADEYILLSEGATQRDLVHELRHALARRVGSGSIDKLDRVWKFRSGNIAPKKPGYSDRWRDEEMLTTNKEHQFMTYSKLRDRLKRKPTADEYFKEWSSMPSYKVMLRRSRLANGYQQVADGWRSVLDNWEDISRRYREAMMSISRNRTPYAQPYGAFPYGSDV